MKKILVAFMFLGVVMCSATDPDIECYSVGYVDGLKTDYQSQIDSLKAIIAVLNDQTEIDVIADTFSFNMVDDRLKITVKKEGYKVWYTLIDGTKRINTDYIDYESSIMIMDTNYTVGSLNLNDDYTKGSAYVKLGY